MYIRRVLKKGVYIGAGILTIGEGYFDHGRGILAIGRDILAIVGGFFDHGRGIFWPNLWLSPREARYTIGRWGWGGPLGSSYDGYLQKEARYAIKIKEYIAIKSVSFL